MSLHVDYFSLNSGYTKLADVDFDSEPTDTSSVDELNIMRMRGAFWEGGAKNYFAARYHGDLNVSQAGSYTFFLNSDSNAMLYLNGKLVAENVGGSGGLESEITLDLSEGAHDIEVRYFDGRGRSTLQLEWKGPDSDGKREVIGGDAFSKDEPPIDDKDTGNDDDTTGDDTGSGDHDHGDETGDDDGEIRHFLTPLETDGAIPLAVSTTGAYVIDGDIDVTRNGGLIGP
ncbi:MAG: PA14 domain-containing protein, partial [Ruegeria sp.]